MIHDLVVAAATLAVFIPTATVWLVWLARRKMREMMRPPTSPSPYSAKPRKVEP